MLVSGPHAFAQYTFQECDAVEETELRTELNTIAQQALASDKLEVDAIVARQWIQLDLDKIIDNEVDIAVADVRSQEDYLSRLWSGWSTDKANELATKIAESTFNAEPFLAAMTELSQHIADDIAGRVETASIRSVSSALNCLQAFIGNKYSKNLVGVFEDEVTADVKDIDFGGVDNELSITDMHSTALAGVGVIIASHIARRLIRKLMQRVAGRIAGRIVGGAAATLVPVVGWIAGAGMIAYDLWDGANGAIPQIEETLKSATVKDEIKAEIVAVIEPELERELPKIAQAVANDIHSTWMDFKKQYANVLALAEENGTFKALLDDASTEEIYKLSRLVGVSIETIGREQLDTAIDRGLLQRVFQLPGSAADILAATKSLDHVLAWGELAGQHLDAVAEFEIHKLRGPDDFDKETLAAVIAIDNKASINKLLLLKQPAVEALLTLPSDNLKSLTVRMDSEELDSLAAYVTEMDDVASRNQLVARLLKQPKIISELQNDSVRRAVVASSDISSTLEFVSNAPSLMSFLSDTTSLFGGDVSVFLFWHKYGSARNVGIVLIILAVLILPRLFRRRSRAPQIIVNVPANPQQTPQVKQDL